MAGPVCNPAIAGRDSFPGPVPGKEVYAGMSAGPVTRCRAPGRPAVQISRIPKIFIFLRHGIILPGGFG